MCFHPTENLQDYILVGLFVLLAFNLMGMAFLKIIPPTKDDEEEKEKKDHLDNRKEQETKLVKRTHKPLLANYHGELTLLQAIKTVDFHLLCWPSVIANSIAFAYTFSLVVYLKSFQLENLQAPLLLCGPIAAACSKVTFGILSDKTLELYPRILYFIVVVALQDLTMFLSTFIGDKAWVVVVTTMILFIASACSMALVPMIVSDAYGTKHQPSIFGTVYFGSSLGNFIFSFTMGAFYDLEIEGEGDTCYGLKCFRVIFILFTVLGTICLIMFGVLYRHTMERKNVHDNEK